MINTIKDYIYTFFKNEMAIAFPDVFALDEHGFSEKIYWKKTRDEAPQKPYIVLDDIIKGKINRAHETYRRKGDNKLVQRENWMMRVTFSVYNQGTENNLATPEREASDYIEYIERLFNSPTTFDKLANFIDIKDYFCLNLAHVNFPRKYGALLNNGIIVNEKEISGIRDLSSFEQTNYSFRYEIDVTFEFDIITEPQDYGVGKQVGTNINIKDTDLYITQEIIGD